MVLPIPNDYLVRNRDDIIIVYFYKYFNIFSIFVKKKQKEKKEKRKKGTCRVKITEQLVTMPLFI